MDPEKPPLLCRILGHRWIFTMTNKTRIDGKMTLEINHECVPFCLRCGKPNPNYEK